MKRLIALLLTLVGLTALLGSCGGGGEEEAATLAVAFRLDEGSPVMVAYIGDPAEDPFQLEPGRYYIEALDGDDVVLSLGAVDIEAGDVVDFPTSFEAAGGVADAEQAEPLITLASFLIDAELAKYEFLEVVTGGFSESPFDPAVDLDPVNFQGLSEMAEEIAAQEDAVLGALSEIEGRMEVSLGISYVRSPWAPAVDLDETEATLVALLGVAVKFSRSAVGRLEGATDEEKRSAIYEKAAKFVLHVAEYFPLQTYGKRKEPANSGRLMHIQRDWRQYAKKLVEEKGITQARSMLKDELRKDLQRVWGDDISEDRIRDVTELTASHLIEAVPELASEPAPAVAQPTEAEGPEEGEEEEGEPAPAWPPPPEELGEVEPEPAPTEEIPAPQHQPAPDADLVLPEEEQEPGLWEDDEEEPPPAEEEPSPAAEEPPPAAEEPSPAAEEPPPAAEEPSPVAEEEPAEEPEVGGDLVTALGKIQRSTGWLTERENTMTLIFDPAGGPGSVKKGSKARQVASWHEGEECGPDRDVLDIEFEGIYDPDSNTFEGKYTHQFDTTHYPSASPPCPPESRHETYSDTWQATLEDGVITGSLTHGATFELTVQGQ